MLHCYNVSEPFVKLKEISPVLVGYAWLYESMAIRGEPGRYGERR